MAMVVMRFFHFRLCQQELILLERDTINHFLKGRGRMQMKKVDIRVKEVRGKICELACDNEGCIYIIIKIPGRKRPLGVRIDKYLELLIAS